MVFLFSSVIEILRVKSEHDQHRIQFSYIKSNRQLLSLRFDSNINLYSPLRVANNQ